MRVILSKQYCLKFNSNQDVSLPVISKHSFDLNTSDTHKLLNRAISKFKDSLLVNINQQKDNVIDLTNAKLKHLKHVEQTKFKWLKFMW